MNNPIGQLITIETPHKHHANPEKQIRNKIQYRSKKTDNLAIIRHFSLINHPRDSKIEMSFNSVISFI